MKHITKSAGVVAGGTTVSRILGYIRDMLVAHVFGASIFADAFYAAYRIPNLLRRLLGEGAVSAAVIPVLSEYYYQKESKKTTELINSLLTALIIILSIVTVLGMIFSKQLVTLIAYGFTDTPEKIELTTTLTRLMFPFLFFISLAALALGILNTAGKFFIPSVAPASLSISEIMYILAVAPLLAPDNQIKGLAISVMIGGAGQFLAQAPHIMKLGFKIRPCFKFNNPGFKKITYLMLPTTLGMSVDQINSFVDTICASFLPLGSITALYYSNRVMQLPLAIFAIAVATVSLPSMSISVAKNDVADLKETINYSIRLLLFAILPSMLGLMILGLPIIKLLFERGEFRHSASLMTYSSLFFYSFGLPAYAVVKIFASAFYSYKETKTPVKVAAAAMIINAILNVILMYQFEVGGLALATAIASYFNATWLFIILRRKIGRIGAKKILKTFVKIIIISFSMCALTWILFFQALPELIPQIKNFHKTTTAGAILFAVWSYIFLSHIFGVEELDEIKKVLRRKIPFL